MINVSASTQCWAHDCQVTKHDYDYVDIMVSDFYGSLGVRIRPLDHGGIRVRTQRDMIRGSDSERISGKATNDHRITVSAPQLSALQLRFSHYGRRLL